MSKRKKEPAYRPQDRGSKKNLRRVPMVITAQTDHHLAELCAINEHIDGSMQRFSKGRNHLPRK